MSLGFVVEPLTLAFGSKQCYAYAQPHRDINMVKDSTVVSAS